MEFTLSEGVWEYWFKDKETGKPLTPIKSLGVLMLNETKVFIDVPQDIEDNKQAVIFIQRTR